MTTAICDQIDQFRLVSYRVLNIEDKISVARLLRVVDQSIGYMYVHSDAEWLSTKQTFTFFVHC